MIQEKIGEALGLEKAAQKAVEQLYFTRPLESRAHEETIKNEERCT